MPVLGPFALVTRRDRTCGFRCDDGRVALDRGDDAIGDLVLDRVPGRAIGQFRVEVLAEQAGEVGVGPEA